MLKNPSLTTTASYDAECRAHWIAAASSVLLIVLGCVVLAGWVFHLGFLKSLLPGFATMKVNTAFSFLVAGLTLRLQIPPHISARAAGMARLSALFIVASGTLEITVQRPGEAPHVVYRMGPGESVGAIGLITGSPYAATAVAMTHVRAYRLDRDALAASITQMPTLRLGLEALAERGQAALRNDATAPENHAPAQPEMLLAKLRAFISLLGT